MKKNILNKNKNLFNKKQFNNKNNYFQFIL